MVIDRCEMSKIEGEGKPKHKINNHWLDCFILSDFFLYCIHTLDRLFGQVRLICKAPFITWQLMWTDTS